MASPILFDRFEQRSAIMNIVPDGVHRTRIYGGSDGGQRWTAHDVIDVVLRRGRLVLASLGVCLALAVFYLATTPDSFTAVAVLIMDTKQTPPSPSQSRKSRSSTRRSSRARSRSSSLSALRNRRWTACT